nr:hypothetical protein HK105_005424 [Polyrhizophydium stewartii]
MRESTHTHFKFNRRTIAISLILTGLIPAWLYWNTVKYQACFFALSLTWSSALSDVADIPDLAGKVVIVTGGSNGLGLASAVALAAKGAHVIVSCRNEDKGNAAVADIKAKAGMPAATVEFGIMEQSDLASVRRFADWFLAKGLRLDVLMLNAGVFGEDAVHLLLSPTCC